MKKIKILKPYDIYPGKNNGYLVDVTYKNGNTMEQIMHKEEVDLFLYLEKMKKKLSKKEFNELKDMIEMFGAHMYQKASDDAAMDAAGASL
jgi:hypothetical protein